MVPLCSCGAPSVNVTPHSSLPAAPRYMQARAQTNVHCNSAARPLKSAGSRETFMVLSACAVTCGSSRGYKALFPLVPGKPGAALAGLPAAPQLPPLLRGRRPRRRGGCAAGPCAVVIPTRRRRGPDCQRAAAPLSGRRGRGRSRAAFRQVPLPAVPRLASPEGGGASLCCQNRCGADTGTRKLACCFSALASVPNRTLRSSNRQSVKNWSTFTFMSKQFRRR